ncbi:MAG TPA: hypothetical protein VEA81_02970 [Burkholderiaceae bacterium]|nr:hypothetical protein [Burkholderiaceae bacterium]
MHRPGEVSGAVRAGDGIVCTPSLGRLVIAGGLLCHAVLVLAGIFELPAWVPVVECLGASLIGVRQLRRIQEADDESSTGAAVPPAPPEPSGALRPSPFPARRSVPPGDGDAPRDGA